MESSYMASCYCNEGRSARLWRVKNREYHPYFSYIIWYEQWKMKINVKVSYNNGCTLNMAEHYHLMLFHIGSVLLFLEHSLLYALFCWFPFTHIWIICNIEIEVLKLIYNIESCFSLLVLLFFLHNAPSSHTHTQKSKRKKLYCKRNNNL